MLVSDLMPLEECWGLLPDPVDNEVDDWIGAEDWDGGLTKVLSEAPTVDRLAPIPAPSDDETEETVNTTLLRMVVCSVVMTRVRVSPPQVNTEVRVVGTTDAVTCVTNETVEAPVGMSVREVSPPVPDCPQPRSVTNEV